MASQIEQGAKRVFVASIPKVTGLDIATGFKSFSISWLAVKGINNLLFYEIQKANTPSFAEPTTFTSPQTTLTIPTSVEHEVIYVRVRVINSKFQVGQWSSVVSAVGSSNFRINSTRASRATLEIPLASFNTWVDVQTITVSTTTAALCVSVQPGVFARISSDFAAPPPARNLESVYTVFFRLLRDGVEFTSAGQSHILAISQYQNNFGESENTERKVEKAVFGVIVSPLVNYADNSTATYTVQAFVSAPSAGNGTYSFNNITATVIPLIDLPFVIIDNFDVLEMIQVG